MDVDELKRLTGAAAAELVEDGMRVGLGTGSTVRHTVDRLADLDLDIVCVPTSVETDRLARRLGLHITDPDAVPDLHIAIDGADEVDTQLNLIKGGGGAHFRERLVAEMAERFVVVVDESKLVDRLGDFGVPIEVMAFGHDVVARHLKTLGAEEVYVRPETADSGNLILDAEFGLLDDPLALADRMDSITGLVAHGIFPGSMVSEVLVARPDGTIDTITHARDGNGAG
ncbi:MAG: ribose-5-phosphate isomerase RpiA [Actinomycetota bacterium]